MKALRRNGFWVLRSSGSHHIMVDNAGVKVTIPVHVGKIIGPGLLKKILKDVGWEIEELREKL